MTLDVEDAVRQVEAAGTAADLFGAGDPTDEAAYTAAHRHYRRLARVLHPDTSRDARATAAFSRLAALWSGWSDAAGGAVTLTTRRHRYTLGPVVARGDLANLYTAQATPVNGAGARSVVVKMTRRPANNDLVAAEARTLKHLNEQVEDRYAAYLPSLVETFRHRDTRTGIDRHVTVLGRLDGFHTLAEVAAAYPAGLDPRDAAWMWRRLLVALGVVHRTGVVHGAVLPEHVLIHPEDHGLVLVDFGYATDGVPVPALVPRYRDRYPVEVLTKQPVTAATDIAMATRLVADLMGARTPTPLRAFIRGCTLTSPQARPDDAWALLGELDDLLERLYGPRRFRPFTLPTPPRPADTGGATP